MMNRRHVAAGLLSLPIASVSSHGWRNDASLDDLAFRMDAAIDALEEAIAVRQSAALQLALIQPALPSAVLYSLDDRHLGIWKDCATDGAGKPILEAGRRIPIVTAAGLRECLERLAGEYPDHALRVEQRLTAVEAYEQAVARALEASGMSKADEDAYRAAGDLQMLIEQTFDVGTGIPGIERILARGIASFASAGAAEAVAAGSRWGVKLAELLASPAAHPGPAATPARVAA